MFLGKGVLKICSKFTGENNFIETVLRRECSPVNLLHICTKFFPKNTSDGLLLQKTVYVRFPIDKDRYYFKTCTFFRINCTYEPLFKDCLRQII